MAIDPRIPSVAGDLQGVAYRLADLERKVRLAVTRSDQLAPGAIQGVQIQAGTITTVALAAGSVTADIISAGAVYAGHITAGAVTTSALAANSVTANAIAANSVTANAIAAASIYTDAIQSGAVNATKLAVSELSAVSSNMGSITAGRMVVGGSGDAKTAIGTGIATSGGTKAGIVGTDASNAITFWLDNATGDLELKGTIKSGSTGLGNLDGAVYNTASPLFVANPGGGYALVTDAITAREIAASAITTIKLSANAITAEKIAATAIDGMVITGTTLRTASSGERVELSGVPPIGVKKYDAAGNVAVSIGETNGLEILGGVSATPPLDRRVSWKRATGQPLTDLVGFSDTTGQSALYGSVTSSITLENLIPNPRPAGAGAPTAPWTTTGDGVVHVSGASMSAVGAGGQDGGSYFTVATPGASALEGIRTVLAAPHGGWVPGSVYKLRFWLAPGNGTETLYVWLARSGVNENWIALTPTPGEWTLVERTFTSPAEGTSVSVTVSTTSVQVRTFAVSHTLVSRFASTAPALPAYFDGSMDGNAWTGAAYASKTKSSTATFPGFTWSRYILREDGKSGFLQIPNPKQASVLWGRVAGNGAIANSGSGSWSVTKLFYFDDPYRPYFLVTIDPALSITGLCPAVTAEVNAAGMTTRVEPYTSNSFYVVFQYGWAPDYYLGAPFSFTAHGLTAVAGAVA